MVTTERNEVKTTHTPGPWRLNDALEVWAGVSYEAHQHIATVTSFPNIAAPLGDDVVEANARLIAAAPELLEALELALPYAKRGIAMAMREITRGEEAAGHADGLDSVWQAAEAAIAKARGQS